MHGVNFSSMVTMHLFLVHVLGPHLTTLSVFYRGVNKTFAILGCYPLWNDTYRRFGKTYPSHFPICSVKHPTRLHCWSIVRKIVTVYCENHQKQINK